MTRRLAPIALASCLVAGCGGGTDPGGPVCTEGPAYTPPEPFVPEEIVDLVRWVDPMIGSGGSGNVIPGALVPHGMVRVSPDTLSGGSAVGAYHHDDERIEGFTHTHLEGPGGSGNGYSEILLMAGVGTPDVEDPTSAFSHDDEEAEPGYYRVRLSDPGVDVELTAAAHAGMHRYTFPAGPGAWMVVDLANSKGRSTGGRIEIAGSRTVRGEGRYEVHPMVSLAIGPANPTSQATVYFHAEFSQPFASRATYDPDGVREGVRELEGRKIGALLGFDATAERVVEVRIGISFVSEDQARRNLEEEIGEATFEEVRARARAAWNEKLNRIRVEADDDTMTRFYTALYHSMFQPANYAEAGGCYAVASSGLPVVLSGGGRPFYTDDWCMWDTFRTLHPLGTLLEPEIRADVVTSMLTMYQEGGWLPKCTWHGSGYSRVMTGNPQLAIIADAWVKGLDDFDTDLAWEAMLKTSDEEVEQSFDGLCGYLGLGTPPEYIDSGYVGHECDGTQAASMTLEIAHADFCMAEVAALTGRSAAEARFRDRAQSYRNQWNPDEGFMQPRRRDGSWVEPFDPADTSDFNGFVEASSWIFSFFVPHDVHGLIELMGGEDAFIARLDQFFADGHHDASNQPSFHIPWLYNHAGRPSSTQEQVRRLLADRFSSAVDGLPGNDDAGAMSAWYVLAAVGLYPVNPGSLHYQISTPAVQSAVIHLNPAHHDGGTFTVQVEGSPDDVYIQSATLDGDPLDRPYVTHEEITSGADLHLVVGPTPSDWGSAHPSP